MNRAAEKLLRCVIPIIIQLISLMLFGSLLPGEANAGIATSLAAVAVLPVWYMIWKKDGMIRGRNVRENAWGAGTLALGIPAAVIAGAAASRAAGWLMESLGFYEHYSNQTQEQLLAAPFLVQLIGLGILVPIAEEWLYRGIVYERIREWAPAGGALLITAGLFAIGHGNLIQIVYAFPMGIILSLLYIRSGSIYMPIAFHIGANLITVLMNMRF